MGSAQEGVDLALAAHRRGLLDERGLELVLAYYGGEGALAPLPPEEVLARLGGVSPERLRGLVPARGRPFGPRLLLRAPLGSGGMGTVYEGYDRVLQRRVAVKVVRPDKLGSAAHARYLARFEREARAMARVRHPSCVAIFDVGRGPEGEPYLVMELVEGESLAARLAREGPQDPRRVARWGKALAEGLAACHEAEVVHRDVKPANVLLDAHGLPHLTDFGIALDREALTKLTASMAALGTLGYLPPEQAGGREVDARADVYALGATLYEALTGRLPFEGKVA
ncbi:MAG: serine/threonine protein kinase, partial [Planctomycetota bacterium]